MLNAYRYDFVDIFEVGLGNFVADYRGQLATAQVVGIEMVLQDLSLTAKVLITIGLNTIYTSDLPSVPLSLMRIRENINPVATPGT